MNWINVKDSLPAQEQVVLAYVAGDYLPEIYTYSCVVGFTYDFKPTNRISEPMFFKDFCIPYGSIEREMNANITHWMPLPFCPSK